MHFVWKTVNEVNLKLVCLGVLLLNMHSVASILRILAAKHINQRDLTLESDTSSVQNEDL